MRAYKVEWEPEIEEELLAIWMSASKADQESISRASEIAHRELAFAPESKGEVVAEGLLRYWIPPLAVYFHVETDRLYVRVVGVRRV
jgi:hypothetical protein